MEVKVAFTQENEDGKLQKQQQVYLIETLTFADAESKALEQVKPFAHLGSDIEVQACKRVTYDELLLDNLPRFDNMDYYKAKVTMTVLDETGKEKPMAINYLVLDESVPEAYKTVQNYLKGSINAYTIDDVVKTKIIEVLTK